MKKVKRSHGICRFVKDALKIMSKGIPRHLTNNHRKMHGLPLRRKYL